MSFFCDVTEQYLMKVYDDLQKEQNKLMNSIKSNGDLNEKQTTQITRQISYINSINVNIIKLNNLKKKMQEV